MKLAGFGGGKLGDGGEEIVPLAQVVEKYFEPVKVPDRGEILVPEAILVFPAQAGKIPIKLLVIVSALPVAQGHAESGDDIRGTIFLCQGDDLGDVLFRILDQRQEGHHGHAGQDAVGG